MRKEDITPKRVIAEGEQLFAFPVYYQGWEMDSLAEVYRFKGYTFVVGTNHGTPYFMTRDQLQHKVDEYTETMKKTVAALDALMRG